jgi:hypothetical protein
VSPTSVCSSTGDGYAAWLVCSGNDVVTSITFASYGEPAGAPAVCSSYAINTVCHAMAR